MNRVYRPSVLLFGDSITQQSFSSEFRGWGACLSDWYSRYADVTNRGFSGYNSRWGSKLIEQLMPLESGTQGQWENLALATVFFGANDSVVEGEKQYVPLEEYGHNLAAIVNHIRVASQSEPTIILVTPPVVDSKQWPSRNIENTKKYAAVVRTVARDLNVHLLDLWAESPYKMELTDLRDGLHYGETGNTKMAEGIKNIIRNNVPHLCPEDGFGMKMHFPYHGVLGDAKYGPESEDDPDYYANLISTWDWEGPSI